MRLAIPFLLVAALLPATATADPGDAVPAWVPDAPVNAAAISGSTAYIAGDFSRIGPYTGGSMAVDRVTGDRRPAWPDVAGTVRAVAADGAGGWYLGGSFRAVAGVGRTNLAHVLPDGSVDPAWAPATDSAVDELLVQAGTVYAGGAFRAVDGQPRTGLAALDAATGAVTSFDAGLAGSDPWVQALALGGSASEPILYVGGSFASARGASRGSMAAFRLSDGLLLGFDPAVAGGVYAIALARGLVYAGGMFEKVNGTVSRRHLAAFDPASGAAAGWNALLDTGARGVYDLEVDGSTLYATGHFNNVGGNLARRNNAVALDTATALPTPWAPQLDGTGTSIEVLGQTVYVGGAFTRVNLATVPRAHLAAFDNDTGLVRAWDPSPHAVVWTIASDEDELIVGGEFLAAGGVARRVLAAIDLATGRPTDFDAGVQGGAVLTLAIGDSGLWIGGTFSAVNGSVPRARLANLDRVTGKVRPFEQSVGGPVRALALDGSTVYAGGDFTTVGGTTRRHVAAFRDAEGTTGSLLTFDADADARVRALALAHGRLYLGGDFATLNGGAAARSHIAAVHPATGAATSWDPGADKTVRALTTLGRTVFAGGDFDFVNGGIPRRGVAALDADTAAATAWDAGLDGPVFALATDGTQVFAGGTFAPSSLAAFDGVTGAAASWSPSLADTFPFPDTGMVGALAASPSGWLVGGGRFAIERDPVRGARLAEFRLPPAPAGEPPLPGGDTTAPVITRFAAAPRRFRVGAARGTRLRFTLSEPAGVRVVIERVRPGRRLRRRVATLTRTGLSQGRNAVRFSGRLRRRALLAGRYRATITAADAAGNRSIARRASFRIVRRRR
jgi:hypothetical protein